MTGAALAEAAQRLCPDLPVLLVTALPENPHALINEGSVFSGVIGKPLSAATLAQATLSAIAHHGRGDQS
jgi:CheY-like chemotaxis protein